MLTLSIKEMLDTLIYDEISYFECLCCEMQALPVDGISCDLFARIV